jgi:CubicO group peptidase (beta-lactamase class C family)
VGQIEVRGTVAEGYERVRDEFAAVVAEERGESGPQLAAYVHGRQVVDLWAGEGVTGDSLTGVYSSTKGAAFLVVALVVQDGGIDLDRPVARYWPEFAVAGKAGITVRDVLTHRAGLIGVDGGFTPAELADDRLIAERLAVQRPFWRPGAAYGYHAYVIGALLGEVVRRVTGRTIQELYEELIRVPFDLDLYLGLPEELEPRYLPVLPRLLTSEQESALYADLPSPLMAVAYNLHGASPTDPTQVPNTRAMRARGQASAGGVGSARGLARLFSAAISGLDGRAPLLKPETLAEFSMLHSTGTDLVRGDGVHYTLGFEAKGTQLPFLGPDAFGHTGTAGCDAFADPGSGIAYGYTRRRCVPVWEAPENRRLASALHQAATSRRASK